MSSTAKWIENGTERLSSGECLGDLLQCESYRRVASSGSFITVMEEQPCCSQSQSSGELEVFESDADSTLYESSEEKLPIGQESDQSYDPFEPGDTGDGDELTNLSEFSDIVKTDTPSATWVGVTQSEADLERYRRYEKQIAISWTYITESESPSGSSCEIEPYIPQTATPHHGVKVRKYYTKSKIPRYRGSPETNPGVAEHSEVVGTLQIEDSPRKEANLQQPTCSGGDGNRDEPRTAKVKVKPAKAQKPPVKPKKRPRYRMKPIFKARSDFDIGKQFARDNAFEPLSWDRQPRRVDSQTQTFVALIVADTLKACRISATTFTTVGGDSCDPNGSGSVGVIECAHSTADGEQPATPPPFAQRTPKGFPLSGAMQVQPIASSSETHTSRENSPRRRRSCRATKTLYADLRSVLIRFVCFWMMLLACLALYHSENIQEYCLSVYAALREWYYPPKPPLTPRQKIAKGVKTILGLFKL